MNKYQKEVHKNTKNKLRIFNNYLFNYKYKFLPVSISYRMVRKSVRRNMKMYSKFEKLAKKNGYDHPIDYIRDSESNFEHLNSFLNN